MAPCGMIGNHAVHRFQAVRPRPALLFAPHARCDIVSAVSDVIVILGLPTGPPSFPVMRQQLDAGESRERAANCQLYYERMEGTGLHFSFE